MTFKVSIWLIMIFSTINVAVAENFDAEKFANDYFAAWTATQKPTATKEDIEQYLSLLTDDVGHQHLPYDPDGTRNPDGKESMREGMTYYLGGHTEYTAELSAQMTGYDVVIIKYSTASKGVHPQTKQVIEQSNVTIEVLELEDGKVSVIRKYSE